MVETQRPQTARPIAKPTVQRGTVSIVYAQIASLGVAKLGVVCVMNPEIQLDHLTDRELLLLTANGVNEAKEQLKAQGGRLRALEDWRNIIVGGLTLLTAVVLAIGVPVALKLWG